MKGSPHYNFYLKVIMLFQKDDHHENLLESYVLTHRGLVVPYAEIDLS